MSWTRVGAPSGWERDSWGLKYRHIRTGAILQKIHRPAFGLLGWEVRWIVEKGETFVEVSEKGDLFRAAKDAIRQLAVKLI